MTHNKWLRATAHVVLVMFLTLIVIEAPLRLIDPWGVYAWLKGDSNPRDENGLYIAGDYGHVLITDEQTRFVPDTSPSDCQIVAIGDSLTFGFGVRDSETWVNQLALRFPAVQFINGGISGTNSGQVLASIDRFPDADGFIWVIVNNDILADEQPYTSRVPHPSLYEPLFWSYIKVGARRRENAPTNDDPARFWSDIDAFVQMDNLLMVAYDNELGVQVEDRYPDATTWIEYTYEQISFVDGHPRPAGHVDLADALEPHVQALIASECQES